MTGDPRRAWGSTLSVAELAAIRSCGFRPVGQVMGSCVHQFWPGIYGTGMYGGAGIMGGGLYGGYSLTQELPEYAGALRRARRLALDRMSAEAAGAHGVVGVRLNLRRVDVGASVIEFTALGTAVQADGLTPEPGFRPFLSLLSGTDFARLLRSGYVPCGVVMGVCALWVASGWRTAMQLGSWYGQEVQQYSEAAMRARDLAMASLRRDMAEVSADGAVGGDVTMEIHEWEGGRGPEHMVEFLSLGTAVTRFFDGPARDDLPHPVIRLT